MENFTPYTALAGGLLIGISATVLLLFNGRITGISGILGGLLFPKQGEWPWRLLFLLGIMAGALSYHLVFPDSFAPRTGYPLPLLIIGGFLVGFGTRMGNGCTSGHGVCGIGRGSMRSIVATTVFMLTGVISVYIIQHVMGMSS